GIRDFHVTGVQTCALPIYATGFAVHPYPQGAVAPDVITPGEPDYADLAALPRLETLLDTAQRAYGSSKRFDLYSTEFGYKTSPRSEERRVGKEGRAGWGRE